MELVEMFLVDTKGTCLLCQNDCDIRYRPGDPRQMSSSNKFKMLLRHLKVNPKKLEFSNILTRHDVDLDEDGVNLLISLCSRCTLVNSQFLEKFEELENIKLQLNYCCDELHDLIQSGRKKGTGEVDGVDDRNARLAEILREETLDKCSLRLHLSASEIDVPQDQEGSTKSSSLALGRPQVSTDITAGGSENLTNPATEEEFDLDSFFMSTRPTSTTPTTSRQSVPENEQSVNFGKTEEGGGELDPLALAPSDEENVAKLKRHNLRTSTRKSKISRSSSSVLDTDCSSSRDDIALTPIKKTTSKRKRHSQKSGHKCSHCGKVLSRPDHLQRHIKNLHPTEDPDVEKRSCSNNPAKFQFSCCQCGKVFSWQSHFLRHFQSVHAHGRESRKVSKNPGKFQCSHCVSRFRTRYHLDRHIQAVHLKVQVKCDHCPKSFSRKERLNHHLMMQHPLQRFSNEFSWKPTKKQFFTAFEEVIARTEKRRVGDDDGISHTCPQCEKTFSDMTTLRIHVLQFHFDQVLWQLDVVGRDEDRIRNGEDAELGDSDDDDYIMTGVL